MKNFLIALVLLLASPVLAADIIQQSPTTFDGRDFNRSGGIIDLSHPGVPAFNPVRDHDAPIDGITDAAAAINASLADCLAAGGGRVVLPPYQYVVSGNSLNVAAKCSLEFSAPPERQQQVPTNMLQPALRLSPTKTIQLVGSLRNIAIIQQGLTAPTSAQDVFTQRATFAGTAVTALAPDVRMDDVLIIGFNTCANFTNTPQPAVFRLALDCRNGLVLDHIHSTGNFIDIFGWEYYPGNSTYQYIGQNITGVANNGSGLYRLTVASTAGLATNNPVMISAALGSVGVNGPKTITVVDGTHLDIQGSSVTGGTITGSWAINETLLTLPSIPQGLWYGSTIAGVGIPAGTTVVTIDFDRKAVRISAPTTGAGLGATLTYGDPSAYTSGGLVEFRPVTENLQTFIKVTNSEQNNFNNVMQFGWATGLHFGFKSVWQIVVNYGCDNWRDPTRTCILLTDNAEQNSVIGGQAGGSNTFLVEKNTIGQNRISDIYVRSGFQNHQVMMSLQGAGDLTLSGMGSDCVNGCATNYSDIIIYSGAARKKFDGNLGRHDVFPQNRIVAQNSLVITSGTIFAAGSPYGYVDGSWTPQLAFGSDATGFTYLSGGQQGTYVAQWPYYKSEFLVALNGPLPPQTGFPTIVGGPPLSACADFIASGSPGSAYSGIVNAANMTGLTGVLYALSSAGGNGIIGLRQSAPTGAANLSETNFTTTSLLRGTMNCRMAFTQR